MIDFIDVSVSFGLQTVLNKVSFRIGTAERTGIVGANGAGKSTILNLLTGDAQPNSGKITLARDLSIGYLRQQLKPTTVNTSILNYAEHAHPALQQLHDEIHELENAALSANGSDRERLLNRTGELQFQFEHMGGYLLNNNAKIALCGLGFSADDLHKPFRSFSGGWQMRAELARALVSNPELLLLDEPTNFLDIPAVEWLQRFLRDYKGTLLLISHDRYLLNTLTNATLEVAAGQVTRYSGNYDDYVIQRQSRYEQLAAAKKNQDRQRTQVERFIERFRAKNTKASQVQSRIRALEKMEAIIVPQISVKHAKIRLPKPTHCGVEVLRLEDAGISYDNGENWVLRHVDLTINRGEKTAIVGLNGLGKTTLLRALAGKLALGEGQRVLGHKVNVGYQAQDFAETMDPSLSIIATAKNAAPDMPEQNIRSILGSFLFSGDSIEKVVDVLSGGEKMRLALVRLLLQAPNFLLLDEPTTHLDIPSREALEQALTAYEGTLFLVSHDVEFVRRVAPTIIAMVPQNLRRFAGNLDYYLEKLDQEQAAQSGNPQNSFSGPVTANSKKALRQRRALQRQEINRKTRELKKSIARLEKQIGIFEEEQLKLAENLSKAENDPSLNFGEIGRRLKTIEIELAHYNSRWEEESLRLDQILKDSE